MIQTQRLLTNSQGALEDRFGLRIAALAQIEGAQGVERYGNVQVGGTKYLLADSKSAQEEVFGLLILAVLAINVPHLLVGFRYLGGREFILRTL